MRSAHSPTRGRRGGPGPGLRTFIVTPALDEAGAPTHRIERSLTGGHADVVEDVTDSYRRAVFVAVADQTEQADPAAAAGG